MLKYKRRISYVISLIVFFTTCSPNKPDLRVDGLIIEIGYSYKVDVLNGTYEVNDFLHSGKWLKYHFALSQTEKDRINKEYNRLNLDSYTPMGNDSSIILIENKCRIIYPTIYTFLKIKTTQGIKVFQIDESCRKYGLFNYKGHNVQSYLDILHSIIRNKKEVRLAPKSSVIYL